MELKEFQEIYDRCNFSDEEKKAYPRPETEEDLEKLNNLLYQPPFGWAGSLITMILLWWLFTSGYNTWSIKSLEEMLKADENKNPEQ